MALRMIHAGNVATSSDELAEAIERTEDLKARLVAGGYGTEFTAEDLFPLYQGAVARATNVVAQPVAARRTPWLWIVAAGVALAVAILVFASGAVAW